MRNILISACLLATASLPSFAADPLLDAFAADKARIANDYQAKMKVCKTRAPSVAPACRSAADSDRRNALLAASAERDAGLKCRTTCGLISEVKQATVDTEAKTAKPKQGGMPWQVSYTLYSGETATQRFDKKPEFAAGDKISLQNGKLAKR